MLYRRKFVVLKSSDQLPTQADSGYGYLYIIGRSPEGPVKIGISINPRKRVKDLESAGGAKIKLIWLSPLCSNFLAIETDLHERLQDFRMHGEWFDVPFQPLVEYGERIKYKRRTKAQHAAELHSMLSRSPKPA